MKYDSIGSTFREGKYTLEVRESEDDGRTCTGCWYASVVHGNHNRRNYNGSCYLHGHACTPINRKDGKQVVFTRIK